MLSKMDSRTFLVLYLLCHHPPFLIPGTKGQRQPININSEQENSSYFSTTLPFSRSINTNGISFDENNVFSVLERATKKTDVLRVNDKPNETDTTFTEEDNEAVFEDNENKSVAISNLSEVEQGERSSANTTDIQLVTNLNDEQVSLPATIRPWFTRGPIATFTTTKPELAVIELAGEFVPVCHAFFFCFSKCNDLTRGHNNFMCACDDHCIQYGDCCIDIFPNCFNLSQSDPVLNFINDRYDIGTLRPAIFDKSITQAITDYPQSAEEIVAAFVGDFSTCENINMKFYFPFARLISKCPKHLQDESLRDKCEGNISSLRPPVTAVIQDQCVMFKNSFCAACHDVGENDLYGWQIVLDCNETLVESYGNRLTVAVIEELVNDGQCKTEFNSPSGLCEPRPCTQEMMLTESDEERLSSNVANGHCTPDDAMLCKTYISPREGYRNLHCKRCLDNSTRSENGTSLECEDLPLRPRRRPGLILILDITGHYTADGTGQQVASYSCGETEVFDSSSMVCKQLLCARGYEPYYGKCYQVSDVYFVEPMTQPYPNSWSELKLDFTNSEGKLSCDSFAYLSTDANLNVSSYKLVYQQNGNMTHIIQEIKNFTEGSEQVQCFENILGRLRDNLTVTEASIITSADVYTTIEDMGRIARYGLPSPLHISSHTSYVRLTTTFDLSVLGCPFGGTLREMTDYVIEKYKDAWYVTYNEMSQKMFYPLQNVFFERFYVQDNYRTNISETILVCDTDELFDRVNCSVVTYHLNQTFINGSKLLVLTSGIHYDETDYQIVGDQVFVCSDFKAESYTSNLEEDTSYLIVSWVFTVVAILFLLTMVVCYCVFPDLCNLPGKMTASLAGTMMFTFLFNLFTLVELHHEYVCPVAAALSHLVTLAHFGWMSAIAVNMALTFGPGSISRINTLNNKKAFMRYNVVVWGSSFIIVLTSVILDIVHSDSSSDPQDQPLFADNNTDRGFAIKARPGPLASSSSSSSSSADFPRYGYPYCTWFSGPIWSRLAFVVIPYFITFLINVVSFILTLVGIQRSSQEITKIGGKSSDRIQCLIYIKLSTAMGFSWSLSLLTNFVEKNEVLPYIYITLVLLQGFLLFLAFMVNKRVYGLITRRGADLTQKTKVSTLSTSQNGDTKSNGRL